MFSSWPVILYKLYKDYDKTLVLARMKAQFSPPAQASVSSIIFSMRVGYRAINLNADCGDNTSPGERGQRLYICVEKNVNNSHHFTRQFILGLMCTVCMSAIRTTFQGYYVVVVEFKATDIPKSECQCCACIILIRSFH